MKRTLVLLSAVLAILGLFYLPKTIKKDVHAEDSDAVYQCVGRSVAGYMNNIIALSGNLQHVRLGSPAFNLTSQYTPIIFDAMVSANANFAALAGFTGNVYTITIDGQPRLAYDWYANELHPDGRTWKGIFDSYGKRLVLTEFGDFDTFETKPGSRPDLISRMKGEHNRTADDGSIAAIIYFNALGTNPGLAGHRLTDDEIRTITADNQRKAGINSAARVQGNGDFPRRVQDVAPLKWTSEIIYSPSDLDAAVNAANSATAQGMVAVLRPCDAFTCGFSSPADLAAFIRALDRRVSGEVWVIAGPNEPDIERWASPNCGLTTSDCRTGATGDREHHSLRPYPGCPWDGSIHQIATLCGSKLTVSDQIKVKPGEGSCVDGDGGSQICTFKKDRSVGVTIDLSQADLPIMGNTELVENGDLGTTATTKLSPEARINDYVSWYLNGTINRAENKYPEINPQTGTLNKEDEKAVVNFSGPLNKLLPLDIQWEARKESVSAGGGGSPQRHDQIVACTYGIKIRFPPWPFPGSEYTIGGIPAPCYETGIPGFIPRTANQLSDWLKTTPPLNIPRLPPYFSEKIYKTYQDYYKAYMEWRGKLCFQLDVPSIVPFFGGKRFLLCGDDPGGIIAPNFWSNLYPYVPYSSTEDRVGYYSATAPTILQSDGVNVTGIKFNGVPKELYFAHMEEVNGLATLLQSTFAPQIHSNELVNDIASPEIGDQCQILDTRYNPGDKLLPNASDQKLNANLSYSVEFNCTFPPAPTCGDRGGTCKTTCSPEETNLGSEPLCGNPLFCCAENPIPAPERSCTKNVVVPIDVATGVPLADEVWKKLVGGASSAFRRFYPKVGKDSALREIKDVPGSTIVSYQLTGGEGQQIEGNPNQLYLPHLGGIQEYFLRGIQKALRPKDLDATSISGSGQTGSCPVGIPPWCSVEYLLPKFDNDITKATNASQICQKESGSNPRALNVACTYSTDGIDNDGDGLIDSADPDYDKATLDYSVGLFQINLLAHCPGAFRYTVSPPTCTVIDEQKKNECLQRLYDPEENIAEAYRISSGGTNWRPWSAAAACGI